MTGDSENYVQTNTRLLPYSVPEPKPETTEVWSLIVEIIRLAEENADLKARIKALETK